MKKCTDCKYTVEVDHGYSNWTVEGTDVHCLKKLNPSFPVDRFYGEDPVFNYAEECDDFETGCGIQIDVERDALNDPEVKETFKLWDFEI